MTNAWIQTFLGLAYTPLNPQHGDIYIEDISHALSMQCRFNGHCKIFYSVAEHSYHTSFLVPDEDRMAALLHDAAEAYLGDWPRPLKHPSEMDGPWNEVAKYYRAMEKRNQQVIFERFDIPYPVPESVKQADITMLMVEKRDIIGPEPAPWSVNVPPDDTVHIVGWNPEEAGKMFRRRYRELGGRKR